ncbi:IstB-like ATP binding protein [Pseudomonas agarici]|nr:IstB-like ATP binding protein [Pseudomonas agarici]
MASHLRSPHKGRHTTQTEHMPKSPREHAERTPQQLIHWAEQTGSSAAGVIAYILARRIYPRHGFRACLDIQRLSKQHGEDRLETACQRALALGACSYKSLESILRQGPERLPLVHKACRDGYSVRYLRLSRLMEELGLAHGDVRFAKLMASYTETDLLILDDWGLAPFTAAQRRDMLELLDDRYDNRSTR